MTANIIVAWIAILAGTIAGTISGLFYHEDAFLGGYGSWTRRLTRLAHVAFFGIGLINLAAALTARAMGITSGLGLASLLLIVGAITMPLVCYLAAWRKPFRHIFFIPVLSVLAGVALFIWRLLQI